MLSSERRQRGDDAIRANSEPIARSAPAFSPYLRSPTGVLALQRLACNAAVAAALGADQGDRLGESVAALPLKTLTINASYVQQNKDVEDHFSKANAVYHQAGVHVDRGAEERPSVRDAKKILGEDLILEEGSPTSPSDEERKLLKTNRAPGTITAYFVDRMSQGAAGESFWQGTGQPESVVVAADVAAPRTLPHELGHVLLNDGSHPDDNDNFMAQSSGGPSHKDVMTPEQIRAIRESPFAR